MGSPCEQENFRSRPVSDEILEEATHVFAMTEGHLSALEAYFPNNTGKFFLMHEFSGSPTKREGTDVPDLIGIGLILASLDYRMRVFP